MSDLAPGAAPALPPAAGPPTMIAAISNTPPSPARRAAAGGRRKSFGSCFHAHAGLDGRRARFPRPPSGFPRRVGSPASRLRAPGATARSARPPTPAHSAASGLAELALGPALRSRSQHWSSSTWPCSRSETRPSRPPRAASAPRRRALELWRIPLRSPLAHVSLLPARTSCASRASRPSQRVPARQHDRCRARRVRRWSRRRRRGRTPTPTPTWRARPERHAARCPGPGGPR